MTGRAARLAVLTRALFPFLVGPCTIDEWTRGGDVARGGDTWRSKVRIERCRFLDASACKGMCVGLCKRPSEAYFASLGLPVSFAPNFDDCSCEMVWGRTPTDADLAGADLSCFKACDIRDAAHATRARPPREADDARDPA